MQIVVDANPLISMLITPGPTTKLLFLEKLELIAPELLFQEIENNKNTIMKKSRLNKEEINHFIKILKQRIKEVPKEDFLKHKDQAEEICPDEKDLIYFALALYLRCPIWSNEKALKKQNHIKVYATHELMELLNV